MNNIKTVTLCGRLDSNEQLDYLFIEQMEKRQILIAPVQQLMLVEYDMCSMDIGKMYRKAIRMSDKIIVISDDIFDDIDALSALCYAYMLNKDIKLNGVISESKLKEIVNSHILFAEAMAWIQQDGYLHQGDYANFDNYIQFKHKNEDIIDPWCCNEENLIAAGPYNEPPELPPYPFHGDINKGYDPFKIYGKHKMAEFVEEIYLKNRDCYDNEYSKV